MADISGEQCETPQEECRRAQVTVPVAMGVHLAPARLPPPPAAPHRRVFLKAREPVISKPPTALALPSLLPRASPEQAAKPL